mmetsp:Transcript_69664/g.167209  ORF Transcript_69664/g.167209 Transcript_69664/m.167209 type:complete len:132 (-) Transcript_69664:197-592(-)|eukprot:CAMPEP_0178376724 /NCGR_PEP_ID=MMETSP0689_2-20121128/3550_1 /TAXON_ID=160604 /ORGANISM="Amphidinium massartii, Strain CS-259" /LENGTH=131 /DNA_ID=CAMNT_0019996755 /DNA_START=1 /DNA_END=396 /DNA_ORIENTATION=-
MAELAEQWGRAVAQKRSVIEGHLSRQQPRQALLEALSDPPYAVSGAPQEARDEAAQLVLKAMAAFKEAEISQAVAGLTAGSQNVLMKYIYLFWERGLPASTNSKLFTWHAELVEQGGEGTIVRAIYDWRWP